MAISSRSLGLVCTLAMSACFVELVGEETAGGGASSSEGGGAMSASEASSTTTGLVACGADAVCATIPPGWTLVAAEVVAAGAPPGAGCTTDPETLNAGPSSAGCTPCACDVTQPAVCASPRMDCWYGSSDCTGTLSAYAEGFTGCSQPLPNLPGGSNSSGSCQIAAPPAVTQPPVCAPSGGVVLPAEPFQSAVHLCEVQPAPGVCAEGLTCVPSQPRGGKVCIRSPGAATCPAGFAGALTVYASGTDARVCSPCACATSCSGGGWVVFDGNGCSSSSEQVTGACLALPDVFDNAQASVSGVAGVPETTCPGGEASGAVVGRLEETICCLE